ncbi:hypothetical protein HDU67_006932 [Dinochytrium kinnereticum]|nr:hypothetical protein HDU67_006932 [Dinochytrium kinnereticum]
MANLWLCMGWTGTSPSANPTPAPHRASWSIWPSASSKPASQVPPPTPAAAEGSTVPEPSSPTPNLSIFNNAIASIEGLRLRVSKQAGDDDFEDDDALTLMADVVSGIRSTVPYVMVRDLDSLRQAGASLTNASYASSISNVTSFQSFSWSHTPQSVRDSVLQVLDQTIEYFDYQDRSNSSPKRDTSSKSVRGSPAPNRVSAGHIKSLLKTLRQSIRDQGQVDVDALIELRTYADVPELRRRFWGLEQVLESVEGSLGKVFERLLEELSLNIGQVRLDAPVSDANAAPSPSAGITLTERWWSFS